MKKSVKIVLGIGFGIASLIEAFNLGKDYQSSETTKIQTEFNTYKKNVNSYKFETKTKEIQFNDIGELISYDISGISKLTSGTYKLK